MVKKLAKLIFFIILFINIFMAAWFVLHGDLHFPSDIARDFLLMGEIREKKIILIGERTPIAGLFHGPLWLYLNFPAYLVNNGNPIVVGWFWIFLIVIFLYINYQIASNLFNRVTGYIYVLLFSVYSVFQANRFINPHGVYLILPLYFYLFVQYWKTGKLKYLIAHIIVNILMLQFHLGIGVIYLLLSSIALSFKIIQIKKLKHFLVFLIVPFLLINFIVFNLRHNFIISKALYKSLRSPGPADVTFLSMLLDRLRMMTIGMEITRAYQWMRNLGIGIIGAFLALQIVQNKQRTIYLSFLYFYLGFFTLSLFNKGYLLSFYLYPQVPLILLIFASMINRKKKIIPVLIIGSIFALNFSTAIKDTKNAANIIGKNEYSWKFLNKISQQVFSGPESEFGYFIYSPDFFGYQLKYAFKYRASVEDKRSYFLKKKLITYVIYAPPDKSRLDLSAKWWKENKLRIKKAPTKIWDYKNGYKIEKYNLSKEQTQIPFDQGIDAGIYFR